MLNAFFFPVFMVALLYPAFAGTQQLQKVVVTYSSRSSASIDLFVAQERGYFREEG